MFAVVVHIILSSLVATSAMTLFTYIVAAITQKELGEPKFLNRLIRSSRQFDTNTTDNHIAGWAIHYAIGLIFVVLIVAFQSITGYHLSIWLGMALGAIFGLMGVIGWIVMFSTHHDPPKIEFTVFLIQLVAAHIVFGLTLSIYFRFLI